MKSEIMIDTSAFVDMLEYFKGHSIGYIRTVTSPYNVQRKDGLLVKSRVTKIPFKDQFGCEREDVRCHAMYSVMIGYNYKTAMDNKLQKEAEKNGTPFEEHVLGKVWHVPHILPTGKTSTTFVENPKTGEVYFKALKNRWGAGVTPTLENARKSTRGRYLYVNGKTGKILPNSDKIFEYLPTAGDGLISYRTLKLMSIKRLSFQGQVYVLA